MSPFSIEALRHYYELLDRALEHGELTLEFADARSLTTARHRLNTARSMDRNKQLTEREPSDPRFGISVYDNLTIRREDLCLVIKHDGPVPGLVSVK